MVKREAKPKTDETAKAKRVARKTHKDKSPKNEKAKIPKELKEPKKTAPKKTKAAYKPISVDQEESKRPPLQTELDTSMKESYLTMDVRCPAKSAVGMGLNNLGELPTTSTLNSLNQGRRRVQASKHSFAVRIPPYTKAVPESELTFGNRSCKQSLSHNLPASSIDDQSLFGSIQSRTEEQKIIAAIEDVEKYAKVVQEQGANRRTARLMEISNTPRTL
jgi:hypothetical protein